MSEIPEDIDRIASDIVRADYSADAEPDYAFYLAIAKAILADRQRDQWQLINDEAMSGQRILAIEDFVREWVDDDGNERSLPGDCEVVHWSAKHSAWIGFGLMLESFEPTHWQPLPAAPKGE